MAEKDSLKLMTLKMPTELLSDLDNFVKTNGGNRSEIVRNAIALYIKGNSNNSKTMQQKILEKMQEKQLLQIEKDISQLELDHALLKRKLNSIQNDIAQNLEDATENASNQL